MVHYVPDQLPKVKEQEQAPVHNTKAGLTFSGRTGLHYLEMIEKFVSMEFFVYIKESVQLLLKQLNIYIWNLT